MYAVIVGEPGVGKSCLVQRVVQELSLPVWGLVTRKGDMLEEKTGGFPVYLQHLRGYGQEGEQHLVAYCNRKAKHMLAATVTANMNGTGLTPIPKAHCRAIGAIRTAVTVLLIKIVIRDVTA